MATDKEVKDSGLFNAAIVRKRVEFFASTMDAFLQDFRAKAEANDRLGSIVACARLAQLAGGMSQEYQAFTGALIDSPTEQKVGQQACELVVDLINKNGVECGLLKNDGPDTVPALDRSQN